MMASFCDGVEVAITGSPLLDVLTVFLLVAFSKYDPSSCKDPFSVFFTETPACADTVTLFLSFDNIFLVEGIFKMN